jgi:hypothetical protein
MRICLNPFRSVLTIALVLGGLGEGIAEPVFINPKFPIVGGNTGGRSTLSPPVITAVDNCSTHVFVQSFIPKATVRVYLNGSTLIGSATPHFGFEAIPLTQPLNVGDKLTATQSVNGFVSVPSNPATIVGSLPATLPMPAVDKHIYACGHIVPVGNLLPGVTVSVNDQSTGGVAIGNGFTPNNWGSNWAPVGTSALTAGHQITATQSACSAPPSPAAPAQSVNDEPTPMFEPKLDPPILGNDAVTLHDLYTGANVEVFDHASTVGSGYATGSDNWVPVPAIAPSASISAQQSLCTPSPRSPPLPPVTTIPSPILVGPICPAQAIVTVRGTTIDATLVLLKNGVIVGNGGAAPGDVPLAIAPPSAFAVGDTVQVIEYIGTIVSPSSNIVTVNCAKQNVITQHNNNARQGGQLAESMLTPANVSGPRFGLIYDRHVLGTLLAQPLYVHGVKIKGRLMNIIVVATAEDVVYAFDADDTSADATTNVSVRGTTVAESTKWLWRTPVGSPHVGDICGETVPGIVGITSTPVIDVSAGTIYLVARDQSGNAALGHDYLRALDLTNGNELRKVEVTATDPVNHLVFNDRCQRQRPGLLLQSGTIYLGYGTYTCDAGCPNGEPYRGWIIGFRVSDFAAAGAFTNSKVVNEGGMGVWASGNGLAGDSNGSLFYETGNDIGSGLAALGDSFVKLQATATSLSLASVYQPPFANEYKNGDTDLGAGGPMLLPNGKLIGGGKDGTYFILSQSDLTAAPASFQAFYNTFHFGPGAYPYNAPTTYTTKCPPASIFGVANEGQPCFIDPADYKNGESFGPNIHAGPVLWQNSATHAFIYKMAEKDYLKAFDYDVLSGTVSATPALVATVRPGADGMPGGFSSVSANGRRNGIVWTVVQQLNSMWGPPTPAILYAHDAKNLRELWNNSRQRVALAKFTAPTIADGRVVLPSFNLFQVYGLAPPGAPHHRLPLPAAVLQRWLGMGGAQGLLGEPTGEQHRDEVGLRRDFRSEVEGGGYGRISVPPTVNIEAPMCKPRMKHAPRIPIEASILASPRTGAHYIIGEIRSKFLENGGTKRFGYPLTDEVPTPDGFGLMTQFERETIFWYPGRSAEIGAPKTPPLHVIPKMEDD